MWPLFAIGFPLLMAIPAMRGTFIHSLQTFLGVICLVFFMSIVWTIGAAYNLTGCYVFGHDRQCYWADQFMFDKRESDVWALDYYNKYGRFVDPDTLPAARRHYN
jgi:hypothetical protein